MDYNFLKFIIIIWKILQIFISFELKKYPNNKYWIFDNFNNIVWKFYNID